LKELDNVHALYEAVIILFTCSVFFAFLFHFIKNAKKDLLRDLQEKQSKLEFNLNMSISSIEKSTRSFEIRKTSLEKATNDKELLLKEGFDSQKKKFDHDIVKYKNQIEEKDSMIESFETQLSLQDKITYQLIDEINSLERQIENVFSEGDHYQEEIPRLPTDMPMKPTVIDRGPFWASKRKRR